MSRKLIQSTLGLFCLLSFTVQSQQGHLLQMLNNGSYFRLNTTTISTQLSSNSGKLTNSDLLSESTYDRINNRFFITSVSHIFMIDAVTKTMLDSVPRPQDMINIEYDEICNCLVGGSAYSVGNFTRINLNTKAITTYPFSSAGSMQSGESSFDRINRHYYFRNTQQVRVVDSVGAIVFTLGNYRGIEYDATLNSVVGIFPTLPPVLVRWNLSTLSSTTLCSLPTAVQDYDLYATTYDEGNHLYFMKFQQNVICVNALTGASTTITSSDGVGLEYTNLPNLGSPSGISEQKNATLNISAFPNPGKGLFHFDNLTPGEEIIITDAAGKIILTKKINSTNETVDLTNFEENLFFYTLSDKNGFLASGKLVKRD
jgi:hypothetical protein